jgi:uncharacterized protein DUF4403
MIGLFKRALALIALTLILGLASVTVQMWLSHPVSILPPAPTSSARLPSLPPTTSDLLVGVSCSDAAIAAELEKVIPKSFPFDSKRDGAQVFGNPSRGPISVHSNVGAKQVFVSAPVGGRIQVEKQIIARISVGIDVSGGIDASFSPRIQPDWKISPQLTLSAHVNRAVARAGPLNIDVSGHARDAVGGVVNRARGAIDSQLAHSLDIRKEVEHLWDQISDVHKLSDDPRIWLQITPKQVLFRSFQYEPSTIDAALALVLETHLFIQDAPPERVKVPLPNLEIKEGLPEEFVLALPVEVRYEVLNRELNKRLAQKPIALPDVEASVTVSNATIKPYGEGVLLSVDFTASKGTWASVSGRLYISGKAKFDPVKAELRAEQLDYTTETKNILLESADWLAHSTLLKKMQDAAVVPLADEVDRAKQQANQQLNELKKQLPKEVSADISVAPSIERIEFASDKAFAIVNAKGKISVRINP